MFGYIVRRVISGLLVLLVVSMAVFALFFYGPANPALAYCPETRCTPQRLENITQQLGLDRIGDVDGRPRSTDHAFTQHRLNHVAAVKHVDHGPPRAGARRCVQAEADRRVPAHRDQLLYEDSLPLEPGPSF